MSGSAALQVASAGSNPKAVQEVIKEGRGSGLIPLTDTISRWQSLVVFVVAVGVAWLIAPRGAAARTAADLGVELKPLVREESTVPDSARRPGDWLERSPVFTVLLFALGLWHLVRYFAHSRGGVLNALDLNTVNLILILLLHWRRVGLVRAVRDDRHPIGLLS
ncbi:TIGR00366 family protein, partial [Nocardia terpenica]|uniref:TIGR00366 family protein n=1 Tax=Nocardia terpenica TaxID=455432 RepID=UPI002FE0E853